MSHITTIKAEIRSLEALRAAVKELGFDFVEGQPTFAFYRGQTGNCDHAIRVPGAQYEVGVVKQADGTYRFAFDSFSIGGLGQRIGSQAERLIQHYAKHAAMLAFQRQGYQIHTLPANGKKLQFEAVPMW